jgi:hypothetical protein
MCACVRLSVVRASMSACASACLCKCMCVCVCVSDARSALIARSTGYRAVLGGPGANGGGRGCCRRRRRRRRHAGAGHKACVCAECEGVALKDMHSYSLRRPPSYCRASRASARRRRPRCGCAAPVRVLLSPPCLPTGHADQWGWGRGASRADDARLQRLQRVREEQSGRTVYAGEVVARRRPRRSEEEEDEDAAAPARASAKDGDGDDASRDTDEDIERRRRLAREARRQEEEELARQQAAAAEVRRRCPRTQPACATAV